MISAWGLVREVWELVARGGYWGSLRLVERRICRRFVASAAMRNQSFGSRWGPDIRTPSTSHDGQRMANKVRAYLGRDLAPETNGGHSTAHLRACYPQYGDHKAVRKDFRIGCLGGKKLDSGNELSNRESTNTARGSSRVDSPLVSGTVDAVCVRVKHNATTWIWNWWFQ